jgi:hypothetical protein
MVTDEAPEDFVDMVRGDWLTNWSRKEDEDYRGEEEEAEFAIRIARFVWDMASKQPPPHGATKW